MWRTDWSSESIRKGWNIQEYSPKWAKVHKDHPMTWSSKNPCAPSIGHEESPKCLFGVEVPGNGRIVRAASYLGRADKCPDACSLHGDAGAPQKTWSPVHGVVRLSPPGIRLLLATVVRHHSRTRAPLVTLAPSPPAPHTCAFCYLAQVSGDNCFLPGLFRHRQSPCPHPENWKHILKTTEACLHKVTLQYRTFLQWGGYNFAVIKCFTKRAETRDFRGTFLLAAGTIFWVLILGTDWGSQFTTPFLVGGNANRVRQITSVLVKVQTS